jgi:DNA-binding response OmpR family regulator
VGTPDLPVLFLTARGAEADRLAGFELGADDYVVKLVVVIVLTVVGRCSSPP